MHQDGEAPYLEAAPAGTAVPTRRRHIWRWVLLAALLMIAGCSGLLCRLFAGGMTNAGHVAEDQLPVVERVTASWDLDMLYGVADPELKRATPESVVRAYLQDWSDRLGSSRTLRVKHTGFYSAQRGPDLVYATYEGQFQHGTATVRVTFRRSGDAWPILAIAVKDIVSTQSATTSSIEGLPH